MTRDARWLARSFRPYSLSVNVILRTSCPIFNFRDSEKSIQTRKHGLQLQAISTKRDIDILKLFKKFTICKDNERDGTCLDKSCP